MAERGLVLMFAPVSSRTVSGWGRRSNMGSCRAGSRWLMSTWAVLLLAGCQGSFEIDGRQKNQVQVRPEVAREVCNWVRWGVWIETFTTQPHDARVSSGVVRRTLCYRFRLVRGD